MQFLEYYVYWTVHHLDSWIKIDHLDVTCFIISLFNTQHVSNVSTSILRSLRLICCVISWVALLWFDVYWCYGVVRLGWCGILKQAEATPTHIEPEQYNTWNKSTIIRKLLRMDVLTFETCWALSNEIIKQVTSRWSIFIQLRTFMVSKQGNIKRHRTKIWIYLPVSQMGCHYWQLDNWSTEVCLSPSLPLSVSHTLCDSPNLILMFPAKHNINAKGSAFEPRKLFTKPFSQYRWPSSPIKILINLHILFNYFDNRADINSLPWWRMIQKANDFCKCHQ